MTQTAKVSLHDFISWKIRDSSQFPHCPQNHTISLSVGKKDLFRQGLQLSLSFLSSANEIEIEIEIEKEKWSEQR